MGWELIIIVPLLVAVLIGVALFYANQNKKLKKIDVTPNAPFVINPCRKKFTDGYGIGRLKSKRENKNGTTLVEYYPIDIEESDFSKMPGLKKVVVLTKDIQLDMDFSNKRSIVWLNSRDPSKYPKSMQDSLLGKWATVQGQKAFLLDAFGHGVITAGDEAVTEAMKGFARGGIPRSTLEQIKEENKIARKMKLMDDGDKDKGKSP